MTFTWSSKDEVSRIGFAIRTCSTCRGTGPFAVYRVSRRFTVCSVPVFSASRGFLVECGGCHSVSEALPSECDRGFSDLMSLEQLQGEVERLDSKAIQRVVPEELQEACHILGVTIDVSQELLELCYKGEVRLWQPGLFPAGSDARRAAVLRTAELHRAKSTLTTYISQRANTHGTSGDSSRPGEDKRERVLQEPAHAHQAGEQSSHGKLHADAFALRSAAGVIAILAFVALGGLALSQRPSHNVADRKQEPAPLPPPSNHPNTTPDSRTSVSVVPTGGDDEDRWTPSPPRFDGDRTLEAGAAAHERRDYAAAIANWECCLENRHREDVVANNLAWILATCPDRRFRNGIRAVQLCNAYLIKTAIPLTWIRAGTIAAAFAEAGQFGEASTYQEISSRLCRPDKKSAQRAKLDLYRRRIPYRESVPELYRYVPSRESPRRSSGRD